MTVSLQSAINSAHPITSIGIDDSEKGVHIAVGSSDGMVRVYDAEKGDWRLTATFDVPSLTGLMDKPWEPPPPRQRPKDETVVISSEPSWRSKGSAVPLPSPCPSVPLSLCVFSSQKSDCHAPDETRNQTNFPTRNLLSHRGALGIAGAYGALEEEGQEDAMMQDTASRQCPIISLSFIPPPHQPASDRVEEAEYPPTMTGAAVRKGWASAAVSTGALTPGGGIVGSGVKAGGGGSDGRAVEVGRSAASTLVIGTPSCCLCLSMVTKQVRARAWCSAHQRVCL